MAVCRICSEQYSDARLNLGFDTCQLCGDLLAKEEMRQKSKRVGPIWNKGPDMYLGSPSDVRVILKTAGGRKNVPLDFSGNSRTRNLDGPHVDHDSQYRRKSRQSRECSGLITSGGNGKTQPAKPTVAQTRSTSQGQWVFSHWVWKTDKLGVRYKLAILRRK